MPYDAPHLYDEGTPEGKFDKELVWIGIAVLVSMVKK